MTKIYLLCLLTICFGANAQIECAYHKTNQPAAGATLSVTDEANMNKYDVHYYKLDVEVQNNSLSIKGNASMRAKVITSLSEVVLQLHPNMVIDSIQLNDSLATFSRSAEVLTIQAKGILASGAFFKVVTWYHGVAPQTGAGAIGNGFNNNATKTVTWSLSEPYSAQEWWPCKQVLGDKADSSDVWITTDSVNKAGSNGLLKKVTTMPGGKLRYEWKSKYPIAYYLISVAVCPYQEYNLYAHPVGSDSILIQNYLYKNADPEVKEAVNYTPALIESFSTQFGLYPFAAEKYGHCQSEIGGGMEHQTMTTMGVFNFSITAHELGHQWFGDYVTCRSWADIWLNEGFASYTEFLAYELLKPSGKKTWVEEAMNTAKGATGSVYVNDSLNVPRIFDGASTYRKGAVLLRMLRYEFNNDSLFFAGIRKYLFSHRYGNALAPDFRNSMAQTLGKNLDHFFTQWFYTEGYPVFSGKWNQVNNIVLLSLKQVPSAGSTVFKTSLDVRLSYAGGDTTIRIWVDASTKTYQFNTGGKTITAIRLDADNHILNDVLSLAKDLTFTSSQDINGRNILVYPNPATNDLTIDYGNDCIAEIFDMAGASILTTQLTQQIVTLDISNLKPGVYLLRLNSGNGVSNHKFIKQ